MVLWWCWWLVCLFFWGSGWSGRLSGVVLFSCRRWAGLIRSPVDGLSVSLCCEQRRHLRGKCPPIISRNIVSWQCSDQARRRLERGSPQEFRPAESVVVADRVPQSAGTGACDFACDWTCR
uniref:Putative secreted protein n=1 Tax=Anopheles darlingi TaxID=43151 RepID=A0A2M4D2R4_ANODA